MGAVVGAAQEFGREPGASGKPRGDALRCRAIRLPPGNQQCEAVAGAVVEVAPVEVIAAFYAAPAGGGDEVRQVAIGLAIGGKQYVFGPPGKPELGADDEL